MPYNFTEGPTKYWVDHVLHMSFKLIDDETNYDFTQASISAMNTTGVNTVQNGNDLILEASNMQGFFDNTETPPEPEYLVGGGGEES